MKKSQKRAWEEVGQDSGSEARQGDVAYARQGTTLQGHKRRLQVPVYPGRLYVQPVTYVDLAFFTRLITP